MKQMKSTVHLQDRGWQRHPKSDAWYRKNVVGIERHLIEIDEAGEKASGCARLFRGKHELSKEGAMNYRGTWNAATNIPA